MYCDPTVLVPTHHPAMDDQHRQIMKLLRRIKDAANGRQPRHAVHAMLLDLIDHIVSHFHTEENLMRSVGFPGLARHSHLHASMLDHLVRVLNDYDRGVINISPRMIDGLVDWLLIHVETQDRELARFLDAAPVHSVRAVTSRGMAHAAG